MSFIDIVAPRKGHKQRRFGGHFVANIFKTIFFVGVPGYFVFIAITFVFFGDEVEVPNIPPTRAESEVVAVVHEYLKVTDAKTIDDVNIITNCWTEFGDAEFNVEYFTITGVWRINAYYEGVRYYWRVDDTTLDLTRDLWFQPKRRTILC
jgi:hypothetical protein